MKLTAEFLIERIEGRRKLNKIFNVMKENNGQPGIPDPVKIVFRNDGEMKKCLDKE